LAWSVFCNTVTAQVPQTPTPSTTLPGLTKTTPTNRYSTVDPYKWLPSQTTQQSNQVLIEKAMQHERQRAENTKKWLAQMESETNGVRYEFPSFGHFNEASLYQEAYDKIEQMLMGKKPLSLKEAVYTVEHAFLGDRLPKNWFDNQVESNVNLIKAALKESGYDMNNDMAKKMMLHRFMSDTILLESCSESNYSLPKRYDFHDIFGKKDWTQMFVTKLMATGSGQCHSLPLLYLILAEELQVEAYLAYSPEHSYIKLKDHKGHWFNLELTNGYYSTNAWIMGSGYIEAEALKNDIYMYPLSKQETIAACLVDLAKGYQRKYGFDSFTKQCVDTALEYDPNNIFALQMKSDYNTLLFEYVVKQLGFPPLAELSKDPKAYKLYQDRNQVYDFIDKVGHEPMPESVYKDWLKSLEEKKSLQAKFPRA